MLKDVQGVCNKCRPDRGGFYVANCVPHVNNSGGLFIATAIAGERTTSIPTKDAKLLSE